MHVDIVYMSFVLAMYDTLIRSVIYGINQIY